MKIEIGKEYVTRNGLKAKVYDIAGAVEYPVVAGVVRGNDILPHTYTKVGRLYLNSTSDFDIIDEWQEPLEFDWKCLPAWCNDYIAMDKIGDWYTYSDEPEIKAVDWNWGEGLFCKIPKDYTPKNFKGTWKDSLFKNPNKCEQ
jgi:hypothetical protein